MWVDWYKIVYGGNEQDAKKAWGRKMFMLGFFQLGDLTTMRY